MTTRDSGVAAALEQRIAALRHHGNVDAAYECASGVDRCPDCTEDFDAIAALASAPAAPGLDVERLRDAIERVRARDDSEFGESPLWQFDEDRLAANMAAEYARLAATEPDAQSASGPSASDALGAAAPAEDRLAAALDETALAKALGAWSRTCEHVALGGKCADPVYSHLPDALDLGRLYRAALEELDKDGSHD